MLKARSSSFSEAHRISDLVSTVVPAETSKQFMAELLSACGRLCGLAKLGSIAPHSVQDHAWVSLSKHAVLGPANNQPRDLEQAMNLGLEVTLHPD
jgi:hypothetical protein